IQETALALSQSQHPQTVIAHNPLNFRRTDKSPLGIQETVLRYRTPISPNRLSWNKSTLKITNSKNVKIYG
ncbi:hypothetical protein VB711_25375, partial [Cronbergia sp. UHCC 0137]|uniref:hypothetical protein n=1 Tax=Cronbergia sp. UHCC 0137 TaxID=3110239 RepID=UPI002B1F09CE